MSKSPRPGPGASPTLRTGASYRWSRGFSDSARPLVGRSALHRWIPKQATASNLAPHAADPSKRVPIIMTDADMATRMDPIYEPIARRFHKNPQQLSILHCPPRLAQQRQATGSLLSISQRCQSRPPRSLAGVQGSITDLMSGNWAAV